MEITPKEHKNRTKKHKNPTKLVKIQNPHPRLVKLSTSNLPGRMKYFNRGSIQPKQCLGADGLGDFSYCHKCKSAVCLQNTFSPVAS